MNKRETVLSMVGAVDSFAPAHSPIRTSRLCRSAPPAPSTCVRRRPTEIEVNSRKLSDSLAAADANKILDLFRPDYYVSAEAVRDSISAESIFNLIHNKSVIKVDRIARKN
jgi:hypothetical protein